MIKNTNIYLDQKKKFALIVAPRSEIKFLKFN